MSVLFLPVFCWCDEEINYGWWIGDVELEKEVDRDEIDD
jgi:hypothetical protein